MTQKNTQKHQFSAEVSKVLKLMIHSLYTNKDIFLRELISNASDACDKLRYESLTNPELMEGGGDLKIAITIDDKARTVTVTDNGIGMTRDELINNLGTIAKSGTQEFASQLTGDAKADANLIGQFGVGFYSAFMVADRVTVTSQRAGAKEAFVWESEGEGEFSIEPADDSAERGTRITLHLKKGEDVYLDKFRLRHIVQTYSDHISFPIEITDSSGETETANSASALWTRQKSDITPEQYKEFYHHVAHLPDEPWVHLHHKAEGKLEYTFLLYVPSMRPFDLFHPERRRRVKLYVKRVFITDENVDIIPHYLRFLQGVVDSEDLPLNISRETLQGNPMMEKIKESVVKKVLGELKKKMEKDAEGYEAFWKNFGSVLKEGLCEANNHREQILEVSRFATTTQEEGTTTLDDYISRMKPDQQEIFYLTGEKLETLRNHPQLEGFTSRGIEVLLFADHVDDFWVNVAAEYKGKKFKSVTRADIDLDAISGEAKADKEDEKKEPKAEEGMDALIARLKEIYGPQVRDVRATSKLSGSPVCLAVEEGAMDIRLERFLVENKQLAAASAKILEINPAHPILRGLAAKVQANAQATDVEDVAWLLLDQARILEGEEVADPAAFTRRLSGLVEKSLAA